jgi:hypothetical protein
MTVREMEERYPSSENSRGLDMHQLEEIRDWIYDQPASKEVGPVSALRDSVATSKRISAFGIYEIVYDRAYNYVYEGLYERMFALFRVVYMESREMP